MLAASCASMPARCKAATAADPLHPSVWPPTQVACSKEELPTNLVPRYHGGAPCCWRHPSLMYTQNCFIPPKASEFCMLLPRALRSLQQQAAAGLAQGVCMRGLERPVLAPARPPSPRAPCAQRPAPASAGTPPPRPPAPRAAPPAPCPPLPAVGRHGAELG